MFNVSEIFHSIQGEGRRAGRPCTFVRMQGCKLRCVWCDTPYALDHRSKERMMTAEEIIDAVNEIGCRFVEFTGGEPLEQEGVNTIMTELCNIGYEVAVETGGHIDIADVDERVAIILDIKCPDSRMVSLNRLENLDHVKQTDEVKFVIASRTDYEWSRQFMADHELEDRVGTILMSPAFGMLEYVTLVDWILEDQLDVRFQVQMHKHIWTPETRGV
jgi:7-carboxy-7-deazaguanine synthase